MGIGLREEVLPRKKTRYGRCLRAVLESVDAKTPGAKPERVGREGNVLRRETE